jgi:hypothetical protein
MAYALKIKTLSRANWPDEDDVLLHAAFQCLVNFIEKEFDRHVYPLDPDSEVQDWMDDEEKQQMIKNIERMNERNKELLDLYDWWMKRCDRSDLLHLDLATYTEDNTMLHRLIEARGGMWT